jgi:rhamnogalacturonyl hydrolase YesR
MALLKKLNKRNECYLDACIDVLNYAESQDYEGFSKFDACNSPFVKAITFNNKWLRGGATLFANKFPFNIRPLLGVQKSKNPKGMALFAQAYFNLYQATEDNKFLEKGKWCLDWLIKNPCKGYSGFCWGYNFDWQSTLYFAPKHTPNCVVTVFVGEALIRAYELTGDKNYLTRAQDTAKFLLNDLPVIQEDEETKCVAYFPAKVPSIVLNINALLGAFLAKLWEYTKIEEYFIQSRKLMQFVINHRTDYDAWYYTFPPGDSIIRHDNYHTGGILDAILEYMEYTKKYDFKDIYLSGLKYYYNNLFLDNGAPKWMNDNVYPFDIHGSAQGIITFCKAARFNPDYGDFACKIADWAIKNLYNPKNGYFYYQQGKFFKHEFTLMRWCNAWMCRALSELLLLINHDISEKR